MNEKKLTHRLGRYLEPKLQRQHESQTGMVPILTRLSRALCAWYLDGLLEKVEAFRPLPDPRVSCGHDVGLDTCGWVSLRGDKAGPIGLYTQATHDGLKPANQYGHHFHLIISPLWAVTRANEETDFRHAPHCRDQKSQVPVSHDYFRPAKI